MAVGCQRQAPAALPPENKPVTVFIKGCEGPRPCIDGLKKFRPHRDSILGPSRL